MAIEWSEDQLERLRELVDDAAVFGEMALDTFGTDHQLAMVIEECSEMTVDVCHVLRNRKHVSALAAEAPDLLVMALQAMLIAGADKSLGELRTKVNRLERRVMDARKARETNG